MNIIPHKKAKIPNKVTSRNGTDANMSIILHRKAIIPTTVNSQNGTNINVSIILNKKAIKAKIHQLFNGTVLATMLAATYSHKRRLKIQRIRNNAFFRLML